MTDNKFKKGALVRYTNPSGYQYSRLHNKLGRVRFTANPDEETVMVDWDGEYFSLPRFKKSNLTVISSGEF